MGETTEDLGVEIGDDFVTTIEIRRGPTNYFDQKLVAALADILERLDDDERCRAVVLCSEGKHFCAGANFASRTPAVGNPDGPHLYDEAFRLFSVATPVVAAVQGAAIGGGLGFALFADFRVAAPESRWSANFARLGFHQGFGLSVTLPRLVGPQVAAELLYTGRRVSGEEARSIGLCDELVELDALRERAHGLAREIAKSAPLAIRSIRETLRDGLAAEVRSATNRERTEQEWLQKTDDFSEGVLAMSERRDPDFRGR
jgi:2-(1,2-epoxy-1,2-dihydrophenyl)acetyl-CoA isomerase